MVERSPAGPVDLEFDSGSGHTKDFRKLVFTGYSVKTKPASSLVVSPKVERGSCLSAILCITHQSLLRESGR